MMQRFSWFCNRKTTAWFHLIHLIRKKTPANSVWGKETSRAAFSWFLIILRLTWQATSACVLLGEPAEDLSVCTCRDGGAPRVQRGNYNVWPPLWVRVSDGFDTWVWMCYF